MFGFKPVNARQSYYRLFETVVKASKIFSC